MMMKKFSIGYFADGPWSHHALDLLLADESLEVKFVVPRRDTKDDILKGLALSNKIDYLEGVLLNSNEFFLKASNYNCDLFVSMSYNQIFKNRITNLPPYKTINCHAGKLPFYRGRNILNWVLINDEKEFGITVHYIDEGIDTGDIITQKTFPISDNDNYKSLLTVAFVECGNLLYQAIKLIQSGNANPVPQRSIHPVGFYCGIRGEGDEVINWNQSSRDVFNFIRSVCSPGPVARTSLNGQEIKINKSVLISNAPDYKCIPGQVVGKTNDGYIVKTLDSSLEVLELETSVKIKIGDRFK